jgi:F-type H+-transporting ATPase subunit gamma
MRRASDVAKESLQIETVKDLTDVFESIASNQVAKVKDRVTLSQEFFQLLWKRYTSIRVDPRQRITNRDIGNNSKSVFVMVSAEAGLSGDIDARLLERMLKDYDKTTTDIVVLGTHGATQLGQRNIPFIRFFKVPDTDSYVDVSPVISAILPYSKIIVFYAEYFSLGVQEIKTINLITTMKAMSQNSLDSEDTMSSFDTIFEPSLEVIAEEIEAKMMTMALSQTILESSLAQNASRFNAMAASKKRALQLLFDYSLEFHRAKRSESDRRLREVMISLKRRKARLRAI